MFLLLCNWFFGNEFIFDFIVGKREICNVIDIFKRIIDETMSCIWVDM